MGIEYAGWILLSRQKGGVVSACNTGEIFLLVVNTKFISGTDTS